MSVYSRLDELGIKLQAPAKPVAAFVPFVIAGRLVFVSGHIARRDGKPYAGRVGDTVSLESAKVAARNVAIDLLGTLEAAVGDLNAVRHITKLTVFVNSAPDFTEQHLVANGASELIADVFGKHGAHARSAVGVAQLPFGVCVEVELIAEI